MILASNNLEKVKEIREILGIDIKSLNDLDKKIEIKENGTTFLENASLKAKEVYIQTGIPCIADDSGLEIEALNGFPGVKTHRFLNGTDSNRNQEILRLMKNKKNRTCYFTCAIAFFDGINLETYEYSLKGTIAQVERINNGFGFDSIFLYNNKYLSDMTTSEKNKISPRKIALTKLKLDKNFQKYIDFKN
ncbi:MAG: RdgB/HAM1 family non-canonical purine NTP pyrophosphatase [Bacilli bacterium]|nr:RdgB/HAM1 family non-canonical purine NTP pyrophosphatase [Bacilli bacterium]